MNTTPPKGYRTQSEDTSYETEQLLFERWRNMDATEKAVLMGAASVALQDLTMAGLEQRLPEASRRELELRALALMYGKDLVRKLLGIDVSDESVRIASANPLEVALLATRAMERLGIDYVIVGSAASTVHGEPRASLDVDLTVRMQASDVKRLCDALEKDFHVDRNALAESVRTGFPCNAIHRTHHVKLDIYVRRNEGIFAEELRRARRLRLTPAPGSEANVQSAEDAVLQKLVWYRKGGEVSDRQWRDVRGILKAQGKGLERPYLLEWGRELGVLDLLQRALVEAGQAPLDP